MKNMVTVVLERSNIPDATVYGDVFVVCWHTEVLAVRLSIDTAQDVIECRTGIKNIPWKYSNSHGECWVYESYNIQRTPLKD